MSIGRVFRGRRIRADASAPGILSEDTIALTDVDRDERPEKEESMEYYNKRAKGMGEERARSRLKLK